MLIYKIENIINGKIYIGKTEFSIKKRFSQHLNLANKENPKFVLHKAIKKYGKNNFQVSEIQKCENNEELDVAEKHWIRKLKTKVPNGYNLTDGGEGSNYWLGKKMSETTKAKMSFLRKGDKNYFYGKKHSQETRNKISENKIGKNYVKLFGIEKSLEIRKRISNSTSGNKNHFYGKQHTEISKEKIRIAHLGKKWQPRNLKPVFQFDLNGNLIKKWDSIKKCSRELNISAGNISSCLSGRLKTYKKFFWNYDEGFKINLK